MAATLRVLGGSVCVDDRMNENLEHLPVQMCAHLDTVTSWARLVRRAVDDLNGNQTILGNSMFSSAFAQETREMSALRWAGCSWKEKDAYILIDWQEFWNWNLFIHWHVYAALGEIS